MMVNNGGRTFREKGTEEKKEEKEWSDRNGIVNGKGLWRNVGEWRSQRTLSPEPREERDLTQDSTIVGKSAVTLWGFGT